MKLRLMLLGVLASSTACPAADDAPEGEGGSTSGTATATQNPSTSPSTSESTTGTATTDDAETTGKESNAESSSPTTSGETTGEEGCADDRQPAPVSEVKGCAEPVGEPFCSEGQPHVEDGTEIVWESNPPHSGPHYPMWQSWGEHPETVPRGNWVHNLEHGGIVLAYLCPSDCTEAKDVLRQVIADRPDLRILMTSDPELGEEGFAAISWTWVYRFDTPDLATLLCFVDQHEGNAPEDVP